MQFAVCCQVHFITDSKTLSLSSAAAAAAADVDDDDGAASDIDELIHCFAATYLHVFPASVRCFHLNSNSGDPLDSFLVPETYSLFHHYNADYYCICKLPQYIAYVLGAIYTIFLICNLLNCCTMLCNT